MKVVRNLVGITLLAIAGFSAGRWAAPEDEVPTSAPASVAPVAVDPVQALLASPPSGSMGIGWMKRILTGDIDALEAELMEMGEAERTQVCLEVIARMDAATMQALYDSYFVSDDFEAMESWFEVTGEFVPFAFAERWAELDPDGMLSYAQQRLDADPRESNGDDEDAPTAAQLVALGAVMFAAKTNPDQALAMAKSLPGEWGEMGLELAIGILAGCDPVLAMQEAEKLGEEPGEIFSLGLSPRQAAATLPAVLALEDEEQRDDAVASLVKTWAEHDPAAAFDAAVDADNADGLRGVFQKWAKADPQAAIEALDRLDDATQKTMAHALARSWAEVEPAAALEWAEGRLDPAAFVSTVRDARRNLPPLQALQHFDPDQAAASRSSFQRLAQEDPMAAAGWLAEQTEDIAIEFRAEARDVGEGLAFLGADAVQQGIEGLPPGEFRRGTIVSALEFIGYNDPDAAQAIAARMNGDDRSAALQGLAVGWVESDPRAALDFIDGQRDPAATEFALGRWTMMDPAAVHEWVLQADGSDPAALAERVGSINLANAWAYRDPVAAGEAMLALPEADAGQQIAQVVEVWARDEPLAASAFINDRLEPGHVRDKAVAALIGQIRAEDPEGAAEWTESITDPDLRAAITDGS